MKRFTTILFFLFLALFTLRSFSVVGPVSAQVCSCIGPSGCGDFYTQATCVVSSNPGCGWSCGCLCTGPTASDCGRFTTQLTCVVTANPGCGWNCVQPIATPYPTLVPVPTSTVPTPTAGPIIPYGTWYNPSLDEFTQRVTTPPDNEIFGERYTFAQVNWIIHSLSMQAPNAGNAGTLEQMKTLLDNSLHDRSTLAEAARMGPVFAIGYSISDLITQRPASGIQEIASTLQKFNLASPVYAQGYGYTNTTSIRPLWIASRNTAYFFVIVLLVAAGFMVMFRVKINPQTVVSIQLIIPRLIIALLGITFSYAIAGLVIDLVYVTVIFVLSAVSVAAPDIISTANLPTAINFFATPGFWKLALFFLCWWIVYTLTQLVTLHVLTAIFSLILVIVILFVLLRVWWMMFKAYITLLFMIIIGPWQIMLGVLPGSSGGLGKWLKNIISPASVFVIVPLSFFLCIVIFGAPSDVLGTPTGFGEWLANHFTGPLIGVTPPSITGVTPEFPLSPQASTTDFRFFGGLVLLSMIPKVAQMVQQALKTESKLVGTALGEAMGPIVGAPAQMAQSRASEASRAGQHGRSSTWTTVAETLNRTRGRG
jgi:hypothetical protein